jgi:signal transduction histidine kinase
VKERTAERFSLALLGTTVALGSGFVIAVGFGAAATFGGGDRSSGATVLLFGLAGAAGAAGVSLLGSVMVRRAHNPIGWAFQAMGLAAVTALGTDALLQLTLGRTVPLHPPGITVVGWVNNVSFLALVLPIPAIFLLFPTGQPLSPLWRWALRLWAVGVAASLLWAAFRPGEVYGNPPPHRVRVDNPLAIDALQWLFPVLVDVGGFAALAAAVLGVISLVVRFRRSRGEERAQMRWLAFAALIAGLLLLAQLAIVLTFGDGSPVSNRVGPYLFGGLVIVLLVGIPASVAIAVLKYRLYDLEIVIRKTVVFGLLAAFITAVYAGIVGGIGVMVGSKSSTSLSFVAAAALAVLFQPARDRARRVADRLVYGKRATPYEVLSEFSSRVGEAYAADDVLPRMAQVLAAGTGAEAAAVWLRVGGELQPAAVWPAEAAVPTELPSDAVDVFHQGDLLGALSVAMPPTDPMDPIKRQLVEDLASQAGLVLRNVRLIEELRASRQRLVAAQDEERRKIERNIHDGAQQQLVALAVKLRLAETLATGEGAEKTAATLGQLQSDAGTALEDLRDLARGIFPPLLADKGLREAIASQARKSPVPVDIDADNVGRYPQEVEAAVYFCSLEALQNVAKYAHASRASIKLTQINGSLTFEVTDDGDGFDPTTTGYGTGLQGMADRLDAIGGTLIVKSEPGHGTSVTGRVPAGSLQSQSHEQSP